MEKAKVLKQTSFTAIAVPVGEGGGAVEIEVHPDVTKDARRPNNDVDEGRSGGGWKLPPWAKVGLVVVVMGLVAVVAALATLGSTVPAAEPAPTSTPASLAAAPASCSTVTCGTGFKLKYTAASLHCAAIPCDVATADKTICCNGNKHAPPGPFPAGTHTSLTPLPLPLPLPLRTPTPARASAPAPSFSHPYS